MPLIPPALDGFLGEEWCRMGRASAKPIQGVPAARPRWVSLSLNPSDACRRGRHQCLETRMAKTAIVSEELAKKFATEKDTPYTRWARAEGLDIISAHYVPSLHTVELKPWA